MDSEQPLHLIEQLVPLLREKDFDDIFNRLTQNENTNSRFLLKMELKRKCTPCRRVIDMRNELGALCHVHEFDGVIHFMPAEAIELFQSQCYLYRDSYTLGVYETLQAWYKLNQGRSDNLALPLNPVRSFDVSAIPFASHYGRQEERMHFSSPMVLRLASGERLQAKSSDISLGGIRVSVPYLPQYQSGDQVDVFFTGLEREHPHPMLRQPIGYQILGEEQKEGKYWLRLLKSGDTPAFDDLLRDFIERNRSRYRVSVDYLLSAAVIKGYEQFYLPRMTGMPLFFGKGSTPALEIALRTENNQHILEYWRDAKNRDMLATLFTAARMPSLLPGKEGLRETLIYSFTHSVRSHLYFFSATREELEQSGLTALFFQIGSRRPSWRVYKFSLEACTLHEADLDSQKGGAGHHLQDMLLRERLGRLGYVGMLQEIGLDTQRDEFQFDASQTHNANALQRFGHDIHAVPFETETLHYVQLRKEARYVHKTAIVLRHKERAWVGWTRDISAHGMQIELEEPLDGEKGDIIRVALPRLQDLARNMDLQHLPYRLVSLNLSRTVLHLCIEGEAERHIGHQFFSLLIESNQNKLKTTVEHKRYRGMARALRNLYTHHLFNTPIYVNKLKAAPRPAAAGLSSRPRSLSRLLRSCAEQEDQLNLYPLLQGALLKTLLLDPLRAIVREDKPEEEEVYIANLHSQGGAPLFRSHLASSFVSVEQKRHFIELALQQGEFYSVLVGISRTGRPDTSFIANELDYIAKFAIHKAKKLEEELWSVVGVVELTDTTEATLFRLGIPSGTP
ncbi:PilZ domain-containing protein [Aeromonas sp. FDAARGOS 1415]|uniref:PilZ domain-containing protein n=1 Tax=Aeromonas TaxID=642 RepID=UPI001C245464|nr:PilZ domain-containing protein [Aeromonas sp. FDAARGOS 1415]QXB55484.1 PilZ domain-containing protein [Aeromonas sp. FDAARGOS 1415]